MLGIINGVDSPRYPVLTQGNTFATTDTLFNDQSKIQWYNYTLSTSLTDFDTAFPAFSPGRFGISSYVFFSEDIVAPNHKLDERLVFNSISDFLLRTIPLWIASFLFITSIVFIFALIFKKRVFVFVLALPIALFNSIFGAPTTNLSAMQRLNPTLINNPVQIISGMGSVTALQTLVVNMFIAIVCITICIIMYKKLELK